MWLSFLLLHKKANFANRLLQLFLHVLPRSPFSVCCWPFLLGHIVFRQRVVRTFFLYPGILDGIFHPMICEVANCTSIFVITTTIYSRANKSIEWCQFFTFAAGRKLMKSLRCKNPISISFPGKVAVFLISHGRRRHCFFIIMIKEIGFRFWLLASQPVLLSSLYSYNLAEGLRNHCRHTRDRRTDWGYFIPAGKSIRDNYKSSSFLVKTRACKSLR